MVEPVKLRLDAENIVQRSATPAYRETITIAGSQAQATYNHVWVDPYAGILMIEPYQFGKNTGTNASINRFGIGAWTYLGADTIDDHFEEVTRDSEKWLLFDGTEGNGKLQTNEAADVPIRRATYEAVKVGDL